MELLAHQFTKHHLEFQMSSKQSNIKPQNIRTPPMATEISKKFIPNTNDIEPLINKLFITATKMPLRHP